MVFGSTVSHQAGEPFRRAIKALVCCTDRPELVEKHCKYLDMLSLETTEITLPPHTAVPCAINTGILDKHKNLIPCPARIYVDDGLPLFKVIEAIFVVMGTPNETVCQCSLALDKWMSLIISPRQVMLALTIIF
jgi:hypothetical protein